MNWAGVLHSPSIMGSVQDQLNIHGSLTLSPNMIFDLAGTVHFTGNSSNTIFSAGIPLNKNHVYFDGEGASWTLQDDLNIGTRTLFLVRGSLITNDKAMSVGLLNSWYSENQRALNLGSSVITLSSTSNSAMYIHGSGMSLDAGTSLIRFTGAGSGIYNISGGGLFFNDVIFEATTGTVNVYNLNGGFKTLVYNTTGTGRLYSSNTVDSISFAGVGAIFNDNNIINKIGTGSDLTLSSNNSTYGDITVGGTAAFSGNSAYGDVIITGAGTIGGNSTYDLLSIGGDAAITGNNTIGTLKFSPGTQVTLTSGRTQTILTDLEANGSATEMIIIRSSAAGSQSTINKNEGAITLDYVSLRDNNATGGAAFTANNSLDMGNNTGWTINMPAGKDYYWVGGTGNWDDISKWSLTSGGEGGAGIPSLNDNVFFDTNSFSEAGQVVTIIGDASNDVHCLNMDWNGVMHNPTLGGDNTQNIRIHGSLTLVADMSWDFGGLTYFHSKVSENTITSAGLVLNKNHLYFDGEGGEWTLQDDLNIGTRTLFLVRGSLITNDKAMSVGLLNSWYSENQRALNLGSSVITLSSTSNSAMYIHGSGMSLDAGTSLIRFTGAGSGIYNISGGGLFFNDVIFEATTGTVNVYNLNGGFKTLVYNTTGTGRLYSSNTVDSISFAGVGAIFNDNNIINKIGTGSDLTLSSNNSTYGDITVGGTAAFSGNSAYGDVIITGAGTIGGNSTYDLLSIGGDAAITGNNTIGTLKFSPGTQVTLTSGRTQTILTDLEANGSATEMIIIRSSAAGSQSTINKNEGAITLDYVSLRDNNATGGAAFTANNSLDMGNNTGWTINMPAGKDYYWVGGTGNWDDISKWSLTSGGEGGAGIPSLNDNVFFDTNSFSEAGQVVTIIGDASNDVHCLNMDWNGVMHNPTLGGDNTQNIRIHGSLTLVADMSWDFGGLTYFHSKVSENTITSAGLVLNKNHLYFDGEGGEWTLQDDLNIGTRTLFLVRGSLITNDKAMSVGLLNSWYSENQRALNLGSSVITLSSTSNSAMYIHGSGMSLDAGTSLIRFTGAGSGMYNHFGWRFIFQRCDI
jgi:hypothetical protein